MRARNNRMMLRLSDDECQTLKQSSEKVGVPREVYLRMLIMGTQPKEKPSADFYGIMKELNAIGNSLNQIAKRINSTGNIYQDDMNEVKELMNKVWHTQKSMLSKQPLIKRWLKIRSP